MKLYDYKKLLAIEAGEYVPQEMGFFGFVFVAGAIFLSILTLIVIVYLFVEKHI